MIIFMHVKIFENAAMIQKSQTLWQVGRYGVTGSGFGHTGL